MHRSTISLCATVICTALVSPSPALGQSASDKATAEGLFSEGRRLMSQGNYKDACPKFEASLKLDRGVGAMLNLADCYEKNGQTASAWAEFREASAAARAAGSKDREDLARQRAATLEPKLSRLTISVATQSARVTRDGTSVDSAAFGTAMPVDPGKHMLEAAAPGKQKWSKTIDVASGARVSVDVPALADEPQPSGALSGPTSVPIPAPSADATASASSSQRTVALAAGAVGVIGLAAGTYFGLSASSLWKEAKDTCNPYPTQCASDAPEKGNNASSKATVATIAFAVGVVGVAGGAVLWFTAPRAAETETKVSFGVAPNGVIVRGGF